MSAAWKDGWIDSVNGDEFYWCVTIKMTDKELQNVKEQWEDEMSCVDVDKQFLEEK